MTVDVIEAFDFENYWKNIELPEYFEHLIEKQRNVIILRLHEISAADREQIYTHAGEFGAADSPSG